MMSTEAVRNEKGVVNYLLFVGFNFDIDSGWSTNTVSKV
jgi:hypothetical protein